MRGGHLYVIDSNDRYWFRLVVRARTLANNSDVELMERIGIRSTGDLNPSEGVLAKDIDNLSTLLPLGVIEIIPFQHPGGYTVTEVDLPTVKVA